jgi:hypothetical protein|tara:strand:- start:461 stop:787 length:327 start_codon:yes stop_codon:yes gene_type:complete
MTIEKPIYDLPSGDENHPGYIDPKEWENILRNIPVSEMVKEKSKQIDKDSIVYVSPSNLKYMLQRYEDYLNSPGDTSLSFEGFVKEFFTDVKLKDGGRVYKKLVRLVQ